MIILDKFTPYAVLLDMFTPYAVLLSCPWHYVLAFTASRYTSGSLEFQNKS